MSKYIITESQYRNLFENRAYGTVMRRLSDTDLEHYFIKLFPHYNVCDYSLDTFFESLRNEVVETLIYHLFNISYGENDEYYEYEDVLNEIIGDRMYEFVANYFNHHQRGCGKNN